MRDAVQSASKDHTEKGGAYYDDAFFDGHFAQSLESARIVLPLVFDLAQPKSVVDVGCGRGAWLRACREAGIENTAGLDGNYVNRSTLAIPQECFEAVDLSGTGWAKRKADLAISVEVAEHLPEKSARNFVAQLVQMAPLVLFSAAIPAQGGTYHINEQMPAYWANLFAEHRYVVLDPIRPKVHHDRRVAWWYRQNILLYASPEAMKQWPALANEPVVAPDDLLEWVHARFLMPYLSVQGLLAELPRAVKQAVRRRIKRVG